jgi:hypothetical protein
MFFAGIIYAWSILKAPLTAEFGWGNAALSLNYTFIIVNPPKFKGVSLIVNL